MKGGWNRPLNPRRVKILVRIFMICMGLVFGFLLTEIGLRLYYPDGAIPAAHLETVGDEKHSSFHAVDECGYLPDIGPDQEYGPTGCLANDYEVDHPRAERVLFAGDSVTHRARIIKALRALYGEKDFEYWNSGVESFNTLQEWVLYRDYNAAIHPDHVVLTFHNNDFRATPLIVQEDGKLKIYLPGLSINPWLFRKSWVYRWAWPKMDDTKLIENQVLTGLKGFKEATSQNGIRFTVILHPMLKPLNDWNEDELRSRELSMEFFKKLDIRYIDLLPTLEQAVKDGIPLTESPTDLLHPGDELAERFARQLKKEKLLDPGM